MKQEPRYLIVIIIMKLHLFRIKEGKLEKWKEWGNLLMTKYKEEAIETLQEEGLIYEGFCIFEVDGQYYTLGMVEGEEKPTNMERELNIKHRAMKKECLEKMGSVEEVYEIYNK